MKGNSKSGFWKRVFKRNQVIIAALAVMIIVAGYLNVTGQTENQKTQGTQGENSLGGGLAQEENDEAASAGSDSLDFEDEDIVPPSDSANQDANGNNENGDNKDESKDDSEATAGDDLLASEDGEIGDAILAGTTLSTNYFGNAKLGREQVRAANKETLEKLVNDDSLSEEAKSEAIAGLVKMTEAAALEDELETLLEAKGYETVCYVDTNEVDVIVNALEITDGDVAKIEDVVMRNADIDASGIVITNVVTEE